MDENGGSFVAVRRISQGPERGTGYHSSPAEVVTGSTAWLGRGLSCVCAQRRESDARLSFDLTPSQLIKKASRDQVDLAYGRVKTKEVHWREHLDNCISKSMDDFLENAIMDSQYIFKTLSTDECLQRLKSRIEVSYDSSRKEHQEALKALWYASFPGIELLGLISEQWKEMGWQGKDPSTDFRGGGFISLENLLFFSRNYPKSFQDLLRKQEGNRALWEYPFAVAGVNITFMLIQMLDLQADKPRTLMGAIFLKLLAENDRAFDILYCITFKLMDQQWLAMHASYMDFNSVMKSTRRQLERELLLEDIQHIEDMPSYSLLTR